mmetsp:Transcript_11178/g.29436  ORF Transcript_11178/g.29436 Transcript_11178/m.29436 type:complete len:133 (-) Transcript_11178:3579-3977(-)
MEGMSSRSSSHLLPMMCLLPVSFFFPLLPLSSPFLPFSSVSYRLSSARYLFQKRIDVTSNYRNKSHIGFGDRSHWNKDLFRTTNLDRYVEQPRSNHDVFGMCPKPSLKDWKGGKFTQVGEGENTKQPNYFPL